jgi:outer membrane lipoprotein SlyB
MKKNIIALLIIVTGFMMFSCIHEGYNTQKGAAIGAGLGAIAGQVIGNDTASTLIGAAVGGLVGAVGGNAVDQSVANQRIEAQQQQSTAAVVPQNTQEAPPGRWVEVPGQWAGGKWVPAHKVWVPVNP